MVVKRLTFESMFDGEEKTVTAYFNINASELLELDKKYSGHLKDYITEIVEKEDRSAMVALMFDFIKAAYGVRRGESLIKNDEVWEEFYGSPAYDVLFREVMSTDAANAEFINNVISKSLRKELKISLNDLASNSMVNAMAEKANVSTAQLLANITSE